MNLWLSLSKALCIWPEREAIVDGKKRFTYEQFGRRVAALTKSLRALGLKKGSVAAIASPNCHEFLEAYYACAISGIILSPLNYRLSVTELTSILQDSEAELLFTHVDFAKQAEEIAEKIAKESKTLKHLIWIGDTPPPHMKPTAFEDLCTTEGSDFPELPDLTADDLAHLYYTSGTTGRPKGVMLSHGNVMFNALGAVAELSLQDRDTWIHAAPLFHLADAWSCFAITWVGGRHVFIPQFNAAEALKIISEENVTITVLVPTMLNAMLNDPQVSKFSYQALRMLITGGSPIAPETVRKVVLTFGCEYVQLYGMTETSPFLTVSRLKMNHDSLPENKKLEICSRTGRPFIGAEVKVVRADDSEVEKNNLEVGEIIARGPTITKGYWKQPEATAKTIRNGWIYTGDMAVVDNDGSINIVDRAKDMIITGGENVYSTEVEYRLYEHPAVLECAVIGVPDEHWGESVKACVVKRKDSDVNEQELISFVKQTLANYKAPKSIDFLSELPKTGSGKIYKKELREKFWQGKVKQVN